MSPGVNDPLTAIQCIDQLSKGLVELSTRSLPSRYRRDKERTLRVITTATNWDDIVQGSLRRLIPYIRNDAQVIGHLRHQIEGVREISTNAQLNLLLSQVIEDIGQ
jgi:uncharacterized membrane protein